MAVIQGHIKEAEFDAVVQQLFGPKAYECTNIKHVIKTLCAAIEAMLSGSNGRQQIWDILDLWHFYYPQWKALDPTNKSQRIAFLKRYYSDVRNLLAAQNDTSAIVQIEYFLDSKEIGVQFLGQTDCNEYEAENELIRSWQTPNICVKAK